MEPGLTYSMVLVGSTQLVIDCNSNCEYQRTFSTRVQVVLTLNFQKLIPSASRGEKSQSQRKLYGISEEPCQKGVGENSFEEMFFIIYSH